MFPISDLVYRVCKLPYMSTNSKDQSSWGIEHKRHFSPGFIVCHNHLSFALKVGVFFSSLSLFSGDYVIDNAW